MSQSIGTASQLSALGSLGPQHQIGAAAAQGVASGALKPRGGQNPAANAGRAARNSNAVGSSDEVADVNASGSPGAIQQAQLLGRMVCDCVCPDRTKVDLGLWSSWTGTPLRALAAGRRCDSPNPYSAPATFATLSTVVGGGHDLRARPMGLAAFLEEDELRIVVVYPRFVEVGGDLSGLCAETFDAHGTRLRFQLLPLDAGSLSPLGGRSLWVDPTNFRAVARLIGLPVTQRWGVFADTAVEAVAAFNKPAAFDGLWLECHWTSAYSPAFYQSAAPAGLTLPVFPCNWDYPARLGEPQLRGFRLDESGEFLAAWTLEVEALAQLSAFHRPILGGPSAGDYDAFSAFPDGSGWAVPYTVREPMQLSDEALWFGSTGNSQFEYFGVGWFPRPGIDFVGPGEMHPLNWVHYCPRVGLCLAKVSHTGAIVAHWTETASAAVNFLNAGLKAYFSNWLSEHPESVDYPDLTYAGEVPFQSHWFTPLDGTLKVASLPVTQHFPWCGYSFLPRGRNSVPPISLGEHLSNLNVFVNYAGFLEHSPLERGATVGFNDPAHTPMDRQGNVYFAYLEPHRIEHGIEHIGKPVVFRSSPFEGSPGDPVGNVYIPEVAAVFKTWLVSLTPQLTLRWKLDITNPWLPVEQWRQLADPLNPVITYIAGGSGNSLPLADDVQTLPLGRVVFLIRDRHWAGPNHAPSAFLEIRDSSTGELLHSLSWETSTELLATDLQDYVGCSDPSQIFDYCNDPPEAVEGDCLDPVYRTPLESECLEPVYQIRAREGARRYQVTLTAAKGGVSRGGREFLLLNVRELDLLSNNTSKNDLVLVTVGEALTDSPAQSICASAAIDPLDFPSLMLVEDAAYWATFDAGAWKIRRWTSL